MKVIATNKQSKKQSLLESVVNTITGTIINFIISTIIYPMVGIEANIMEIGVVTIVLTISSIIKNFLIRRFFENNKK